MIRCSVCHQQREEGTEMLNIITENDALKLSLLLGKLMNVFNDELASILSNFSDYIWDEQA